MLNGDFIKRVTGKTVVYQFDDMKFTTQVKPEDFILPNSVGTLSLGTITLPVIIKDNILSIKDNIIKLGDLILKFEGEEFQSLNFEESELIWDGTCFRSEESIYKIYETNPLIMSIHTNKYVYCGEVNALKHDGTGLLHIRDTDISWITASKNGKIIALFPTSNDIYKEFFIRYTPICNLKELIKKLNIIGEVPFINSESPVNMDKLEEINKNFQIDLKPYKKRKLAGSEESIVKRKGNAKSISVCFLPDKRIQIFSAVADFFEYLLKEKVITVNTESQRHYLAIYVNYLVDAWNSGKYFHANIGGKCYIIAPKDHKDFDIKTVEVGIDILSGKLVNPKSDEVYNKFK